MSIVSYVTMVIVYGAKCAFEKFRMQCVIKDTVQGGKL